MVDIKLTPEQIQTLKHHGEDFRNWSNTEKGIEDIQEHSEHERYFKEKLSPENLKKMTEEEFTEIWKKSWTGRQSSPRGKKESYLRASAIRWSFGSSRYNIYQPSTE